MSEFKGTKGKWNIEPPVARGSWIGNENGYSALSCGNTNEENRANALLISKAPEMLEMLNILLYDYKNYIQNISQDSHRNNRVNEIEQLIKQATEL